MSQSPGMSHREHEAAILGTLRRELGETKYDRWLGNASASVQAGESGQDPHCVVIEVDNAFAARWVETKFIPCESPAKESAANRHHLGGFVSVKTTP